MSNQCVTKPTDGDNAKINNQPKEDSVSLPDDLKGKSDLIIENDHRFDSSACAPDLFISDNNTHLRKNTETLGHRSCRIGTTGWTKGVHYWSVRIIDRASRGYITIGVILSTFDVSLLKYVGQTTTSYGFYAYNGHKYHNHVGKAFTSDLPKNGDVIGVLLDLDARTLTYFKNGQILGTAFGQLPVADNNTKYYPAVSFYELGHWVTLIKTTK